MNLTLLPSTAWPPRPLRSVGPAPASAGPAVDVLDDAALMARDRDGDKHAFRRLYERHRGALDRYALRLAGNRSEADELSVPLTGQATRVIDHAPVNLGFEQP